MYAENAAASAAFAVRTWLTDDPQDAVWAARQIYETAELAAQRLSGAGSAQAMARSEALRRERAVGEHEVVRLAVAGIHDDLGFVERSDDFEALARRAASAGRAFVEAVP